MASISPTSSANQYGLQQLRQQQAMRNADQAEQAAQSLRAQANQAQIVADRAQETARSLTVQSDQAQAKAGQARQGLAAAGSAQQAVAQLEKSVDQALTREQAVVPTAAMAPATATTPSTSPAPVVNTQGQVTGTLVEHHGLKAGQPS